MKIKPDGYGTAGIFDTLRESVPLERVIGEAEIGRKSRCVNPGHEDQHPSMHLYDDGHVHCFACGFRGDVVDVWGAVRGIAQPFEAALDLAREFNVALPETSEEARQRAEERRQKIADDKRLAQVCHEALGKHRRVREWWEKRGFDGETQRRFLLGANNDGTEAVIPFWHRGEIRGLVRRKLEGEPKYLYPTTEDFADGYRPLFVPAPLKGEIFLVEGPVDSLAVAAAGGSSIAVGGTNMSAVQERDLRRLLSDETRIFALADDDQSGESAARDWARRFYPDVEICAPDYKGGKDAADLFATAGAEETLDHLGRLAATSRDLMEVETAAAAKLDGPRRMFEYAAKHIVPLAARIVSESGRDAALGLVAAQLKGVNVSWLKKATDEEVERLKQEAAEQIVGELTKEYERQQEEHRQRVEEAQDEIDDLFGPGVLGRLRETAAAIHNVRKDERALELALLVALGAQLAPLPNGRPLGASMLVTAEAGRGKNHLMDAAVEPLPPEFYLAFEIASGQSLYYAADDNPEFLKHKFVYPNEIEGVDALVEFLRPMLSKGSARKFVTNKDSKGRNVLQEIVVEGPVTTAIPTVRNKTDEQLQTRLLVAELPDYVGRVKEHSRAVSELLHPDYTSADHSGSLFLWREGFRQLTARRRVVFPLDHPGFALDDDQISHGARLWANLLGIMSAHAWLEQKNRRVIELPSGEEAIVAEPDDYEVAYKIFNAVCQRTVVNLSDTHRKILAAIHDLEYEFPNRDGFTQREIATGAGVSLGTVSNNKTFLVTSAKLMKESDAGLALPEGADPSWWSGGELSAGVPTPEQVRSWWDETTPPDGGGAEHAEHAEHAPDEDPKPDTPAEDGVQHPPEHPPNTSTSSDDPRERDKRVQSVFNEGVNGQNGTGKANNGHVEDVFSAFSVFKGSGGNTGGKVVHVRGPHPYDVYVGRAMPPSKTHPALAKSEFANPYKEGRDGDLETVIEKARLDVERKVEADDAYAARLRDHANKTLACWCAEPRDAVLLPYDPLRCHAQMLLRIANRLAADVADDDAQDASHEPDADPVRAFLADPPDWFVKQADLCADAGVPERLLNPLANAVVSKVYGGPQRWREALEPVREWIGARQGARA